MRRAQGSIRPHGAGWQVRYRGIYQQVRGTRRDAERALARLVTEVESGREANARRVTFGLYLQRQWLPHIRSRVRPKVFTRYEELIRLHVIPRIGSLSLARLRPFHVQRVVDEMVVTGSSCRTAIQCYRVMSGSLRQAVQWQLISVNPALGAQPPRAQRAELTIPNREQVRAIREFAWGTWLEGPVLLGLATGMRLGEVLGLRWDCVDLEERVIRVTKSIQWLGKEFSFVEPKTSKARRTVALPAFAVTWLRQQRRDQAERRLSWGEAWGGYDVVLDRGDGRPLRTDSTSQSFARLMYKHGMGSVRFHDLRHAYATALLEEGVHPKIVSEAIGHSSVAFTMDEYQHVIPSLQEQAAKAVERAFG